MTLLTSGTSPGQLSEAYGGAGAEPERDTLLGCGSDGAAVAYAWNHPQHADTTLRRVLMIGGVHPGWRRRGLGTTLLGWQLAAAQRWDAETRRPEHGPLRYLTRIDEKLADYRALYEAYGLASTRWFARMAQRFDGAPPAVAAVPGIEIVPLSHDLVEPARLASNEAFLDHWGSQPVGRERWLEELEASHTRPDWCLAALDPVAGEVVGCVINAAYETEWPLYGYRLGWTDRLAVRRQWRKRGVASALLRRSMELFHALGMEGAGIGVDSDNPNGRRTGSTPRWATSRTAAS